ncbi:hypothetical protein GOODEAATRI_032562 [Goodea atripinnis]|uniref:Secreted protein n=1 Tax=Goodea atripinnis TaxID=208336 RepID=A0ABV0NFL0_9TELE
MFANISKVWHGWGYMIALLPCGTRVLGSIPSLKSFYLFSPFSLSALSLQDMLPHAHVASPRVLCLARKQPHHRTGWRASPGGLDAVYFLRTSLGFCSGFYHVSLPCLSGPKVVRCLVNPLLKFGKSVFLPPVFLFNILTVSSHHTEETVFTTSILDSCQEKLILIFS